MIIGTKSVVGFFYILFQTLVVYRIALFIYPITFEFEVSERARIRKMTQDSQMWHLCRFRKRKRVW